MIDYVMNFEFNGLIGMLLFWLPLALCAYGYVVRSYFDFQRDKSESANKFYHPTLTVGTLIGRGLVTIIPAANLLAAVFDVAPEVFSRWFKWIGKVFDQPLVGHKYKGD
jgi:hypothetical protein